MCHNHLLYYTVLDNSEYFELLTKYIIRIANNIFVLTPVNQNYIKLIQIA